jgi:hypothetical protein
VSRRFHGTELFFWPEAWLPVTLQAQVTHQARAGEIDHEATVLKRAGRRSGARPQTRLNDVNAGLTPPRHKRRRPSADAT